MPSSSPSLLPAPSPSPSISAAPNGTKFYSIRNVITTQASFTGATVGAYGDVLVPSAVPADIADPLPAPHGFPLYIELESPKTVSAQGSVNDSQHAARNAVIVQRYIDLYRSMGVEPIKQRFAGDYVSDWDAGGALSFRKLVLTGYIAPPCIYGPNPTTTPSIAFLQKVEAGILSGEIPPGSWAYVWDEPAAGELDTVKTRLQQVRQYAPHLKTMVTTTPKAAWAGLVDWYVPIFEQWIPAYAGQWTYGSCEANGCGAHRVDGTPLMVVESPLIHPFAYPIVAKALGAQAVLYYNGTQKLQTALQPGGEYYAGGNGDGTLVYPGDNDTPWPSMRLLQIKRGLSALQNLSPERLKALVTSPIVWSKNQADYQ